MNAFENNIMSIYGKKGEEWLANLPSHVRQYEALWDLCQLKPFDNLSLNYVVSGYQKEKPIVLKLSLDALSLNKEAMALQAFTGYGAVAVLGYEDDALLLQRAVPGNVLKTKFPEGSKKGIEIACNVIEKLRLAQIPSGNSFPHITELLATLDKEWNIPKDHLRRARKLKQELLQNQDSQVLLHGDLHQDNILSDGKEWLVIDPKGVIGFPINEVWACVEDPNHDLVYISKYFNFKLDDVVAWYYVHLILAACWCVEDNLNPKRFLDLAQSVY